jgi:hypothetical protein
MLTRTSVAITVVICTTAFGLGALGGVVWLAATDHGTEAVGALAVALLGVVWGKLQSVQNTVKRTPGRRDEDS